MLVSFPDIYEELMLIAAFSFFGHKKKACSSKS